MEDYPLSTLEKRTDDSYQVVTYRCGSKKEAMCFNGGRGPKVTRLGRGVALCACLCPHGFQEPRCQRSWWNTVS